MEVLREIYSTERHYLDCLKILIEKFKMPLWAAAHKGIFGHKSGLKTMLSSKEKHEKVTCKEINAIFSNIEIIYQCHKVIFAEISTWFEGWPKAQLLYGHIWVEAAPFLHCYKLYANNYHAALHALRTAKLNPKFAAGLQRIEQDVDCCRLSLNDFLIMPVQRIPRYNLLLESLIKLTAKDHIDYILLEESHKAVLKLLDTINEQKK